MQHIKNTDSKNENLFAIFTNLFSGLFSGDQPLKTKLKKIRGSLLIVVGYLLSPLCWWNDLVFNLPVAYGFGYGMSLISPKFFLGGTIAGYWLSNLVGIIFMQLGAGDVLQNQDQPRNFPKELGMGIATSTAYTLVILAIVHLKIVDISAFIPTEQLNTYLSGN